MEGRSLIHDWGGDEATPTSRRGVVDETLRDGLQSPSARDPTPQEKIALLHQMARIGVEGVAIGMPGAHERQRQDAFTLAVEIARERLRIAPYCAARTLPKDIQPIVDISERAGIAVDAAIFVGSSPIRQYAEAWTLDDLKRRTDEAISYAVSHGLSVMYVTEDTTRSTPESLEELYRTAIRCGATRLCISDTVGHATPTATARIVRFVRDLIDASGVQVPIDWHGHRDRGLDVANAMAAWEAGANRCHGTALGVGERCGNAPIELLLVNLQLAGWNRYDLSCLVDYVECAARAVAVDIPPNHPVVGRDAFRTATGTHAAAVIKARRRGDAWLADRVYSSVPAAMVGRRQSIDVGPLSGEANVRFFFEERGIQCDDATLGEVVAMAKARRSVLSDETLTAFIGGRGEGTTTGPAPAGSAHRPRTPRVRG